MRSLAAAGYSIEIRTLLPGRYLRQMDAANLQDRENQRAGHAEAVVHSPPANPKSQAAEIGRVTRNTNPRRDP